MSSSFNFGSASSARSSVRDALQSYRRAQYLVAGSTVASNDASALTEDEEDEEAQNARIRAFRFEETEYQSDEDIEGVDAGAPRARENSFIGQHQWDEDYDSPGPLVQPQGGRGDRLSQRIHQEARNSEVEYLRPSIVVQPGLAPHSTEHTPLLKKVSFSVLSPPRRLSGAPVPDRANLAPGSPQQPASNAFAKRRYSSGSAVTGSAASTLAIKGHSTFGQTLFNSIAILLGIGMLSEPLAFAYAGWGVGTLLVVSYGCVSCYTAKILARIILNDPRVRSYSDIGRKAFGPKATPIIASMFCLELFAVCVILITLYGDSLHVLMPQYSSNSLKLWGLLVLIPTIFLPLSLLSYTSILGIISTFLMVAVIFIDGFTKKQAPGSLWEPSPTDIGVTSYRELGMAFGLFMAGFAGHAVIPSLARDMIDPSRFDSMINWAFLVATSLYGAIGFAGYLMFGNDVSDEISMDLLQTPGYNPFLNQICLWMLVLSPLSKFALNAQPLNAMIEIMLGIDTPFSSPEDLADKPDGLSVTPFGSRFGWRNVLGIAQRILLTCAAVMVSILVPEFSAVMAILGSFSAFMLSIVGPVLANVALKGSCSIFDGVIIATGLVMAVWGTLAAFL